MNLIYRVIAVCFMFGLLPLSVQPAFSVNVENKFHPGDEISLHIIGYEDLSGTFLIQSDGSVEIPLIGNVKAADLTPQEITERIKEEFRKYILTEPQVILTATYRVTILGEVEKPGLYKIHGTEKITDLIAMAMGLTDRAKLSNAKISRDSTVIVSNLEQVLKEGKTVSDIGIHSGDIIYIPRSWWSGWNLKNILLPLSFIATTLVIIDRTR